MQFMKSDQNIKSNGWLIFASHDITENPSRYGCSLEFFDKIAGYASRSGAKLLPIGEVSNIFLVKSPPLSIKVDV